MTQGSLPKFPKGKPVKDYHKIKRGLGHITPVSSESEPEYVESFNYDHSYDTSLWDSNTSIEALFIGLSVNVVFTSQPEDEEKEIMLHSEMTYGSSNLTVCEKYASRDMSLLLMIS